MSAADGPSPSSDGHKSAADGLHVKTHRRVSSVFLPPQPPIIERTANAVSNSLTPLSNKLGLRSIILANEREIIPNCLSSAGVPRYRLFNYRHYCGNEISTCKYNLFTFIPKNLWEQFHRIANLYFVTIACLNWIPALQAFNRYVGMIPVILILFLTACKDAFEDFRRRRLDNQINSSYCHVWDNDKSRFRKMQWRYVIVGDYVHLSLDDVIPADILLIRSSDSNGICFVETSNLDGETSLKQRRVPISVASFSGEDSQFQPPQLQARIKCEKPNNLIHQMNGRITYEDGHMDGIYAENMLLRGCKLRNTTFVEGIVLYAGKDTKAMMNNSGIRYKRSSLELVTNRFILYCIGILVVMCLFAGIGTMLWLFSFAPNTDSIIFIILNTKSPVTDGMVNMISSILNYQILIPLSLYISVELVKLGQIYFISTDVNLYYEKNDRRMECRSLNIPEELGQIQYVLSDKTGTLTENQMIFRRCAIGGVDYGLEGNLNVLDVKNVLVDPRLKKLVELQWHSDSELLDFFITMAICNTVVVNKQPRVDAIELGFVENGEFFTGNSTFFYSLQDPKYPTYSAMHGCSNAQIERVTRDEVEVDQAFEWPSISHYADSTTSVSSTRATTFSRSSSSLSRRIQSFRNDLVLIRNRLLYGQRKRHKKSEENQPDSTYSLYEAESPDELALVYASKAYGISLLKRSVNNITIALPFNYQQTFDVLKILPFDSSRKRMSIIVRREEDVVVYCKGADSEVMKALSRSFTDSLNGSRIVADSRLYLDTYSTQGLRTLCLARRTLTMAEYEDWLMKHMKIENDISMPDREQRLAESINEIEKDFYLLGVTAIEDRLQDGVEDTIEVLREAGIQVWLLTGDKMETAINIARSCGLFPSDASVFVIDNEADIERTYEQISDENHMIGCVGDDSENSNNGYCIVLSTQSLRLLEHSHELLLIILKKSLSVLCYRMTPSNKAEIVKLVKKSLKGKVLAIGDGANDVPMIQCADVGIGISGQEGMQAVMASDFAIARFRFLRTLLMVHGHWCYDRLARTFLYFLYKNAMFVFVIFWVQIFNGFSGETPMDQIFMMTYPIIFTGAQPLFFGVYDQVAHRKILYKKPELYTIGREGKLYRGWHFWLNIIDALWQAAAIYFIAHFTYWDTTCGCCTFGFLLSSGILIVNSVHLALETHCWTFPMGFVFIFFTVIYYVYFFVEDLLASPYWNLKDTPVDVSLHSLLSYHYWAALALTTAIALIPRFFTRVIWNSVRPSAVFQECLSEHRKKSWKCRWFCFHL